MISFVAVVWDRDCEVQQQAGLRVCRLLNASRGGAKRVYQADGVSVYVNGEDPPKWNVYPVEPRRGVVLGTVLERGSIKTGEPCHARFDVMTGDNIIQSGGRILVDEYWGRYVALLDFSPKKSISVIRDPEGSLQCYQIEYDNIYVYTSDIDYFSSLVRIQFEIEWSYIASYLGGGARYGPSTGCVGVKAVVPGECVEHRGSEVRNHALWQPRTFALRGYSGDFDAAVAELRQTVLGVTSAVRALYGRIMHTVSGGLDSSIVLYCLAKAQKRDVICVNRFDQSIESDERFYSRLAVRETGFEYIEEEREPNTVDLRRLLDAPMTATPNLGSIDTDNLDLLERYVERYKIEAVFSGEGGDVNFYQFPTTDTASDYLRDHGIGRLFFSAVRDASLLGRKPYSQVLSRILLPRFLNKEPDLAKGFFREPVFLSQDVAEHVKRNRTLHPWVRDYNKLPKGKSLQVLSLAESGQLVYAPSLRWRFADVIHPLYSQPIMELCLRVPSYVLTNGGVNRMAARRAFQQELPKEIYSRITKGASTNYNHKIVLSNLEFLRDFLLSGLVAGSGLLDLKALEKALSPTGLMGNSGNYFALIELAAVESWARVIIGRGICGSGLARVQ